MRLFSSNPLLRLLCSKQYYIGTIVRIEKNFEEMKMMEVSIDEKQLLLNEEFTNIIYVETKE